MFLLEATLWKSFCWFLLPLCADALQQCLTMTLMNHRHFRIYPNVQIPIKGKWCIYSKTMLVICAKIKSGNSLVWYPRLQNRMINQAIVKDLLLVVVKNQKNPQVRNLKKIVIMDMFVILVMGRNIRLRLLANKHGWLKTWIIKLMIVIVMIWRMHTVKSMEDFIQEKVRWIRRIII